MVVPFSFDNDKSSVIQLIRFWSSVGGRINQAARVTISSAVGPGKCVPYDQEFLISEFVVLMKKSGQRL